MGSITNACGSYLQPILKADLPATGSTTNTSSAASLSLPQDSRQLSPFAQLMSTLQQLQQSDPAKYKEVTGQIATYLQKAAKTAESDGKPGAAIQLDQLSTDFSNASASGQLPDVKDLAQAVAGHHHHHHHGHAHAAFHASSTGNDALDPVTIIQNALSNAGISG